MPEAQISPPTINASVNYASGKDERGVPLVVARRTRGYPATAAVRRGDAVSFDAPTATAPLSVHAADGDTAIDEAMIAGVALNDAAAGEVVEVGDLGYARITDGATVSVGGVVPLTSAAGVLGASATLSTTNDVTHPFRALGASLVDFYGAGEDAALVEVRSI